MENKGGGVILANAPLAPEVRAVKGLKNKSGLSVG
jgi:hypothetical protein